MELSSRISKINSDLGYGFIKAKDSEDIFFSSETIYEGTSFSDLKVDDSVRVSVINTDRGPFARRLELENGK